ncbi:VOC family protein [Rhodococcus koreensis]|nr:VOC family protein [Rhodococcus koreensis]
MTVAVTNVSHLRLTVTDIGRSSAFYDAVFGFDVVLEVPENAGEMTAEALSFVFGGVIYAFPGGLLGLRPAAPEFDRFDEDPAGLDHLSFVVPSVDDLTRTAALLEELGVDHGGIKHLTAVGLAILEFRDPTASRSS